MLNKQQVQEILTMLNQMTLTGLNNFKLAAVIAARLEEALKGEGD